MNSSFLSIIYFIAFSHALMLTVALWRRTVSGNSGRLLAIFIAVMAYKLFEGGALYSGFYRYVPHLLDLMPLMVMVLGPVFYGYTRQVAAQEPFSAKVWLLHLLPWIGMWLYFNAGDVFRPAEMKIAMYDSWTESTGANTQLPLVTVLILLAVKAHLTTYLVLSLKELNRFASIAEKLRSDSSPQQLAQLRFLTISFTALEATWIGLFIAQQYFGLGMLNHVSEVWLLFIAVIVTALGFTGLQNPAIVFSHEERIIAETAFENDSPTAAKDENIKYINSALPETATNEIAKQVEEVLTSRQLYLDPNLTLTELARLLNHKSHTISQVISVGLNSNFYQLINSYRVQYAVELLEDDTLNWPIERIALESGFNNRVTFNKAFKQAMDSTASEYKKQNRQAI